MRRGICDSMINLRDLLILNLTLQVFDGLFSYQVFSLGAAEANPFVSAAISNWGVLYGLLYKKILACALLLLIFALGFRHPSLAKRALILTASVYTSVAVASLWEFCDKESLRQWRSRASKFVFPMMSGSRHMQPSR
jgi:uncharacterized protein DUF5658